MFEPTRREFLHKLGKTAYITPVILTLPVTPALAGPGSLQSTNGNNGLGSGTGGNSGSSGTGGSGSGNSAAADGSESASPPPSEAAPSSGSGYAGGRRISSGGWLDSPNDWPVDRLQLGGRTFDREALLDLLRQDSRTDPNLALMQELIAVKLNVANGTPLENLKPWVEKADAYFAGDLFLDAHELERTLQVIHWYNTNVVGY